jgi:hypothetical protein
MAVMYATLDGDRIGWPTGADRLLVVSVGTGTSDPSVTPSKLAAEGALKAEAVDSSTTYSVITCSTR